MTRNAREVAPATLEALQTSVRLLRRLFYGPSSARGMFLRAILEKALLLPLLEKALLLPGRFQSSKNGFLFAYRIVARTWPRFYWDQSIFTV